MKKVKVILEIIAVCIFSLSLFLAIGSFAVFDLVPPLITQDVITQATVHYGDEIVSIDITSVNLIVNIFFLSLAALGFSLLLLFYLEGNFSAFLAPAICNFAIVFFIQMIITILPGALSAVVDNRIDILQIALGKAQQANFIAFLFGIALLTLAIKMKNWPQKSKDPLFKV